MKISLYQRGFLAGMGVCGLFGASVGNAVMWWRQDDTSRLVLAVVFGLLFLLHCWASRRDYLFHIRLEESQKKTQEALRKTNELIKDLEAHDGGRT